MSEVNKISRKLLAEGWTKDQTPPDMHPWNDFDGGWSWKTSARMNTVFSTPCGLLLRRRDFGNGSMSFMGVDWTEENDNYAVLCPYFGRGRCELNDPLLEDHPMGGGSGELLYFCPIHETNEPFDYERSREKVFDDGEKVKEERWKAFQETRGGRVCRVHSRYNRSTGEWSFRYDPMMCLSCSYCTVLGKENSPKTANVFYDLKIVSVVQGEGMFPDEERVSITKGLKFLEHPRSETVCEAISKLCRDEIVRKETMRRNMDIFLGRIKSIEVLNVRVERRESRDLLQDLRDVQEGIDVKHASDMEAAAQAKKKDDRAARQKKREERLRKAVKQNGYENLEGYMKHRVNRSFSKLEIRKMEKEAELERQEQATQKQFEIEGM